ncbi:MAG: hypothetical protein IJL98_07780 [Lachnospiraceae bacterium]|nr:hypothetical protein [Lachnospiraceae bacterium]
MNKFKKLGVLLLAMAGLFLLTSCGAMDELKERTGYYTENRNSIEWKGRTYVLSKLDISSLELYFDDFINVCRKDVPVLLSRMYGSSYSTDREEKILYMNYEVIGGMDDLFGSEKGSGGPADETFDSLMPSGPRLYIREDCLQEITDLIKNGTTDHYCVQGWTGDGYGFVLLPDSAQKKLDDILKDSRNKISEEELNKAWEAPDYGFETILIKRCDKTMMLKKDSLELHVLESLNGNRFCLLHLITVHEDTWYKLPDDVLYNELLPLLYPRQPDAREGV